MGSKTENSRKRSLSVTTPPTWVSLIPPLQPVLQTRILSSGIFPALASSQIFGTKDWSPQSTNVETNLTPITTLGYASTATLEKSSALWLSSRLVHFLSKNHVLSKMSQHFFYQMTVRQTTYSPCTPYLTNKPKQRQSLLMLCWLKPLETRGHYF